MFRLTIVALFCLCALGASAEMKDFEKPPAGLRSRITEHWDVDDDDLAAEHFHEKVTETFDEKGELVSREYSNASGKSEKLTYKRVHDAKGRVVERSELDASGKTLQSWTYKRSANGALEVRLRMILSSGDVVYAYRFDAKGRLTELECLECHGSKSKLVNKYGDDGRLKEQKDLLEGKLRYTTEFEYDKKGVPRRTARRNHMGYLSSEEEFNAAGDMESHTDYDYYGMEVTAKSCHEYEYDDSGRMTEDAWLHATIEHRKLVVRRGHTYYKQEFYEKKK